VVAAIRNTVDGSVVNRLLLDLVEDQGNRSLSVQLQSPDVIDAMGVAALISIARRLDERGGTFALHGADDDVHTAVALQAAGRRRTMATIEEIEVAIQHLFRVGLVLQTQRAATDGHAVFEHAVDLLDETLNALRGVAHRLTLGKPATPSERTGDGAASPKR
jgi:hypothetical protein